MRPPIACAPHSVPCGPRQDGHFAQVEEIVVRREMRRTVEILRDDADRIVGHRRQAADRRHFIAAARAAIVDEVGAGHLGDHVVEAEGVKLVQLLAVEGGDADGQILRPLRALLAGGDDDEFDAVRRFTRRRVLGEGQLRRRQEPGSRCQHDLPIRPTHLPLRRRTPCNPALTYIQDCRNASGRIACILSRMVHVYREMPRIRSAIAAYKASPRE